MSYLSSVWGLVQAAVGGITPSASEVTEVAVPDIRGGMASPLFHVVSLTT